LTVRFDKLVDNTTVRHRRSLRFIGDRGVGHGPIMWQCCILAQASIPVAEP